MADFMALPAAEHIQKVGHENLSLLLKSMRGVTQAKVASLCAMSDSTLSDMKGNGYLERVCMIAAACGLKLVPVTERSLSDEHLSALKTLARVALEDGGGV